jgi:hypothetical protein
LNGEPAGSHVEQALPESGKAPVGLDVEIAFNNCDSSVVVQSDTAAPEA